MRTRRVYILLLFFIGLFALNSQAQSDAPKATLTTSDSINTFLSQDLQNSPLADKMRSEIDQYLDKLQIIKTRKKADREFLKTVFFKTHRKFLKHYDASATFEEMMETGVYGCLTGTALYSIILSHFGYEHEIVELTSHVYLKVKLDQQIILLESTLPESGFLENVSEIARATEQYEDNSRKLNSVTAIAGIDEEKAEGAYKRSISLKQLSGLQYHNMAIYNIKEEFLETAFMNAKESIKLYPSKRTELLMEIVINKILQSKNLTKDLKSGILNTYVTQVRKKKLTQR
ncbi:MAG: hypothetical protein HEP71_19005 [Roseivirga sp.]|nr:hypothetical protein [Roseivirga sp.]